MHRFEDIVAWQRARILSREVHAVTEVGRFAQHFVLKDQISRSAISIMSNIAEGFGRFQRRDFHRFVIIARSSVHELRSQLYAALDLELIDESTHAHLMQRALSVDQLLAALATSLRRDDST